MIPMNSVGKLLACSQEWISAAATMELLSCWLIQLTTKLAEYCK